MQRRERVQHELPPLRTYSETRSEDHSTVPRDARECNAPRPDAAGQVLGKQSRMKPPTLPARPMHSTYDPLNESAGQLRTRMCTIASDLVVINAGPASALRGSRYAPEASTTYRDHGGTSAAFICCITMSVCSRFPIATGSILDARAGARSKRSDAIPSENHIPLLLFFYYQWIYVQSVHG